MKTFVTSTFLVAVLGIGLLGINNAFAQGDNGIMGGGNDTSGVMNATLAFAQDDNGIMGGGNDTSNVMNATLPTNIIGKNNTSSN